MMIDAAIRHAHAAESAVTNPDLLRGVAAPEIRHVAVIGGGLMGAGIAVSCILAEDLNVTVVERDDVSAQAGRKRMHDLLDRLLARGSIAPDMHRDCLARLVVDDDMASVAHADLIVEAVFEDVAVKRATIQRCAAAARAEALVATNTSWLDPQEIFAGLPNPQRFLGLHFFAPAHVMRLVEVVRLDETSTVSLAAACDLAKHIGKLPVIVGNGTGFAGNRMLAAWRRAAEYMLADGALPHEIDQAMRAFGMAMGPFESQDLSGLQIAWAQRQREARMRDPGRRHIPILERLCAAGRWGQRAGKGWYAYPDGGRKPEVDPWVTDVIKEWSGECGIQRRHFAAHDVQLGFLAATTNEGALIVEERIAASTLAIDVIQVNGFGFPRARGGPMYMADTDGGIGVRTGLDALEANSPGAWKRAARFA